MPLEAVITKITGLTDADLKGKPKFITILAELQEIFHRARTMVAHNLPFDRSLLYFELQRIGRECQFPWPTRHICTVEASMSIKGHRLKLQELFEIATGRPANQTHRAMGDVELLLDAVKYLRNKKMIS